MDNEKTKLNLLNSMTNKNSSLCLTLSQSQNLNQKNIVVLKNKYLYTHIYILLNLFFNLDFVHKSYVFSVT